jgi:hypothetical protein
MSTLKLDTIQHPDAAGAALTFDSDGTMATATGFSSGGLKVKSSGGGTFSINPPSSASDRTLTLPDEAGTVLTSASDIPASIITGLTQGIVEADQWRVNADFTFSGSGTNSVESYWERNDTEFQLIGSGMTQSVGTFTFPQTGVYLVTATGGFKQTSETFYHGIRLETSTDGGSNFAVRATSYTMCYTTSPTKYTSVHAHLIFDVTNTSTHKIKMRCERNSTVVMIGSTLQQLSGLTFIRLGDT